MIFDKTKMVKNQELQIEALNSQIVSLKDINQITKDLLEIRNSEIKAMEVRCGLLLKCIRDELLVALWILYLKKIENIFYGFGNY